MYQTQRITEKNMSWLCLRNVQILFPPLRAYMDRTLGLQSVGWKGNLGTMVNKTHLDEWINPYKHCQTIEEFDKKIFIEPITRITEWINLEIKYNKKFHDSFMLDQSKCKLSKQATTQSQIQSGQENALAANLADIIAAVDIPLTNRKHLLGVAVTKKHANRT